MKIGVTGATGQLGRLVIEKLKSRVEFGDVVALVRNVSNAAYMEVEARTFDYNQPETLAESLRGIDKLLLISGNEIGKRYEQHQRVIDAAVEAGVKYIAYTSLLRADSSTIVLAPEHFETEQAIIKSGIPYTILRHGWYTENYFSSFDSAIEYGALIGSAGEGKISSATREEYAEADVVVLTTPGHEGKIYELAGDEAYTLNDLAKAISQASGKPVAYQNVSVEEYAKVLMSAGLPEGMAHFFASTHVSTEQGDLFEEGHQLSGLIGRQTRKMTDVVRDTVEV